eukprot:scaffold9498_cov90-Isochrysis_galbana.AAC.2
MRRPIRSRSSGDRPTRRETDHRPIVPGGSSLTPLRRSLQWSFRSVGWTPDVAAAACRATAPAKGAAGRGCGQYTARFHAPATHGCFFTVAVLR